MKILEAGIHLDVPAADYFADPCAEPSLTQSIAKVLIERSPLHAWHAHPKLNPDYQHDEDRKFDVGNIAHSMMIGRGKDIVVLDYDDWRTKDAKKMREDAARIGKLAVLGKHYKRAGQMVDAAREQLLLRGLCRFFSVGNGEVVNVWMEDEGDQEHPIWLRQMSDWLSPDLCEWVDFKTTDFSVAPHGIDRMMFNAGWSIQAAMAERGLDVLDPLNAGRRKFYFVVQEAEYPFQLTVVQLTRGPMTMGAKQLDHAVNLWRQCMRTNRFPGYPLDIVTPEWPGWAEQQWLTREVEHHERKQREPILESLMGG